MFTIRILGSSSATPAFTRFTSAQAVNYNDRYYLVDCGEGTQMQMQRFRIKTSRLDAVFISHIHGDHILGLPGLISSMSIQERVKPLPIYGPAALKSILDTFFELSETYLRFPIEFHALEDYAPGAPIFETDRLQILSLPLSHRTFCRGFLFREHNLRRKFDFYRAKDLEVPREYFHLLKAENEVTLPDGRKIHPDQVLFPREKPLSYAYCSDTEYSPELVEYIRHTSLLYHEATFLDALAGRAKETAHSTARQAGEIARLAEVRKLIIGHFSARYHDIRPLLSEARGEFPNADVAVEGKVFDIKKDIGRG